MPRLASSGVSASDITDTTSTQLLAAVSGKSYYITNICVSNSHATVSTVVQILSGSTVIWSGPAAAVCGGYVVNFPVPLKANAGEAINIKCVTTGAAVRGAVAAYLGL